MSREETVAETVMEAEAVRDMVCLVPIAYMESDLKEKFGIPRQSGLVPELVSRVVFTPEFADERALKGLEGFSHIWLIWGFSQAVRGQGAGKRSSNVADARAGIQANGERPQADQIDAGRSAEKQINNGPSSVNWSPTVRPPRLGGNERMGVFATRSPFRPNPLGLSCVELLRIERAEDGKARLALVVAGADLLDGTPIYDIKPYIPYADARPDAAGGFVDSTERVRLRVRDEEDLLCVLPPQKREAVIGVLAEDPRPAYHDDPRRVYGLSFAGYNIRFRVEDDLLTVQEVRESDAHSVQDL